MDVTVVPVSAPDCPADIDTLLATGVAGPPYILQVHVPADGDSGNGGPCGDGIQASTLNCTPIGSGGVNDTCISREEYESTTGLPLPASCYPEGTEGCFEPQQGYLVRPCCPGYTCALGSMCGGGSVLGGVCIPN